MEMTTSTLSPRPSLQLLGAAPHRLMFFVGVSNLLLAMLWWAAWLLAQRAGVEMVKPAVPAGWLHAYVMQYQMLPSFMFGFLLTVFPRWTHLPALPRWRYAPIGLGVFGGQIATLLGAIGWEAGIVVGWWVTVAGWLALLSTLAPMLWREAGTTWHARCCVLALSMGLIGLGCMGAYLHGASALWLFASIKIGSFGLLLPIYLTVAHRMFPFFAGGAIPGYVVWRPMWVLGLALSLCALHLILELLHAYRWLWASDLPLFGLALYLCWRWWPRTPMPALLKVLFLGLTWLPISFALYSAQTLIYLFSGQFALGRAPAHALFIGFFGSVLIAMVTRVSQGHSGRPLQMPPIAWFAFISIQIVSLLRIGAELVKDGPLWQAIAAWAWLLALTPWAIWLGGIYLRPRIDGQKG